MKWKIGVFTFLFLGILTLAACNSLWTREANKELDEGYCKEAVAKYESLFQEKPKLKEDEKVMARYRNARRCAGDQLVQEADNALAAGHPTRSLFLVEEAKEYEPNPQQLAKTETAVIQERKKVMNLMTTAQEQIGRAQYDAASQNLKQAFDLDPELLEDNRQNLTQMKRVADAYVLGSQRATADKNFAEAEKILLASRGFLPDNQPTEKALTDAHIAWIAHLLETGASGHALLLVIRGRQFNDDPRFADLEAKALAAMRERLRQQIVIKAADRKLAKLADSLRQALVANEKSLLSIAPTVSQTAWMLSLSDFQQQFAKNERVEYCYETYQSGTTLVPNPSYDQAQDRLEDAQEEEVRCQDRLLNLSENQAREMENAVGERQRVLESMPSDPNQQSSWRSDMQSAERRVNDLTRSQNDERQRLQRDVQYARERVLDRQRELYRTPMTVEEPVYSDWPYEKHHQTKTAATSLSLEIAAPAGQKAAERREITGNGESTDYTIVNANKRIGVYPRRELEMLAADDDVRKKSENDAVNKAAAWCEEHVAQALAAHYLQVYQTETGAPQLEAYVAYALLTAPGNRREAALPHEVAGGDLPCLTGGEAKPKQ